MIKIARSIYTLLFGKTFALRVYQRKAIDASISRALVSGASILDVGAGDLGLTTWLKRQHPDWRIDACDLGFSEDARLRASDFELKLHVTDGSWLPSTPGGFDVILLSSVLQMVPEPSLLLELCNHALKGRTGRVVLTVPAEYHFLPWFCLSRTTLAKTIRKVFNVPDSMKELNANLMQRFGVQGAAGFYSEAELAQLISAHSFEIVDRKRTPGWCGTLAWEISLLLSIRWGNKAYAFMGLVYPLVWIGDRIFGSSGVGEHLFVLTPKASTHR